MGLEAIKGYMIGIILMIVIVTSGVIVMTSFSSKDSSIDNTNQVGYFNSTLNKANNITNSVEELQGSVEDITAEKVGVLGWINALVGSVFGGIKTLLITLGFMNTAATESANMFSIPPSIVALLVLITVLIVLFALYEAIMRV